MAVRMLAFVDMDSPSAGEVAATTTETAAGREVRFGGEVEIEIGVVRMDESSEVVGVVMDVVGVDSIEGVGSNGASRA